MIVLIDVAFISPSNSAKTYQGLSDKYSAIEPPTWALLLAESCRHWGFAVTIIDCLAEGLSDEDATRRLQQLAPKVIIFVVYGQNVNAGSTNMSGAVRLSNHLKKQNIDAMLGFIGSHVQALPKETLEKETAIDFVFLNEGVKSALELLKLEQITPKSIQNVTGLATRFEDTITFTGPPELVQKHEMDVYMPGYAWDLLPYKKTPLDLYRSPLWHAEYKPEYRSPYAAIQTALGCQFKCSFCMINLINKDDDSSNALASSYNRMRHWSIGFVERELKKLVEMGVRTIKFTDEMFLLNRKYYMPILEVLKKLNHNDDLKLWAYSRIDTVPSPETLNHLRQAGFRWLCLGIESGNRNVRLEVSKGKFQEVDVRRVVNQIESAGIQVMANYIFGLPGDDKDSIEETYQLSVELNTLGWNTYAAMALPGSPLYAEAKASGVDLPTEYSEFSFHSYETKPLPTAKLAAHDVLRLRDEKFHQYFSRERFLKKLEDTFGKEAVNNVLEMNKTKLKRKIVEEANKSGI